MNDVFSALIEACKNAQREVGDLALNKDNLYNDVNSLKGQKQALANQVTDLMVARDNAATEVRAAKRAELEDIEEKKREVSALRIRAEAGLATVSAKEAALQLQFDGFARTLQEFDARDSDLRARERVLAAKLSRLQDLAAAVAQ